MKSLGMYIAKLSHYATNSRKNQMSHNKKTLGVFITALVLSCALGAQAKSVTYNRYLSSSGSRVTERQADIFAKAVWRARPAVNRMLEKKGLDTIAPLPPKNTLAGKFLYQVRSKLIEKRKANPARLTQKQLRAAGKAFAQFEGTLETRHRINAYTYFQATSDLESNSRRGMSYIQLHGRNFGTRPKWATSQRAVRNVISEDINRAAAAFVRTLK